MDKKNNSYSKDEVREYIASIINDELYNLAQQSKDLTSYVEIAKAEGASVDELIRLQDTRYKFEENRGIEQEALIRLSKKAMEDLSIDNDITGDSGK